MKRIRLVDQADLAGNKVTETNAKGHTMTYGYDQLNRLVTVTDPYNKIVTRTVLDANGNAVKKIDAVGYQSAHTDEERYGWTYTYDLANRLVRVLDPELAAKNKPELSTWTYRYNPAGEKIKETNALGHSTSYAYDGAGRLLQVTDPQGVTVAYSYDRAGNKTGMTDGRGKATSYTYGAFGLLRCATDPTRKPIVYRYNLASSVAVLTDRNGNHTVYAYDNRNLLTSRSVTETGDSIGYGYDETGNRISMTDASGTSSYAYDKNNRLLRITKDGAERIAYTYDAVGNIETVTDSTGFTTSYTYDKSSRLETVTFQGKVTTYQYDDNGNRKAIVYGGGVTEQYEFDRNNRLIGLTNKKPDGSVLSSYRYTYDEAGQQTSKTDSFGTTDYTYDEAGRLLKVNAPGKTTLYGYDRAGNRQSQQETYTSAQPSGYVDPGTETELTYLVKKSEYVYTASNQLQKLIEKMANGAGQEVLEKTVRYLYDDNGNELRQQVSYIRPHKRSMRQVTGGSAVGDDGDADLTPLIEKVSNVFDGFNRLKQTDRIKAGERVTVDYVYDGDDLRTQKVVRSSKDSYAAKTTNYLYDRQHVILETNADAQVSVRYVRGINYIARIDASAKLSYFLYNGHGDVVQSVSEAGEVENQYDYDAFGNATLTVESEYSSAIRYAGEFFDAEVGLYYLRARYYNPYTGRFISEDSYWGEDANPLSLNRYTYVHNSPLMYWDPTGHWAEGDQDLDADSQAKIIALTSAWYEASGNTLKQQQIEAEAEDIRKTAKPIDYIPKETTVSIEMPEEITRVVAQAVAYDDEDVYMTKEQWFGILDEAKITYSSRSYSDERYDFVEHQDTTTTIGRTEITVKVVGYEASGYDIEESREYYMTKRESKLADELQAYGELDKDTAATVLVRLEQDQGNTTNEKLSALTGVTDSTVLNLMKKAYDLKMFHNTDFITLEIESQNRTFETALGAVVGGGFSSIGSGTALAAARNTAVTEGRLVKWGGNSTPCNCFVAGTKVQTDEGEKNIEDIEVGDKVLAKDENNPDGELAYKEVTALYRNQRDDIIKLHVEEQIIETTDNHPFWVEGKGWVFADELQVGDKLQRADGSNLTIDKVEFVKLDEPVTVYNFTVADFHTYYVTDIGIWVHNTKCGNEGTGNSTESPALKGSPYHPDSVAERIKPEYRANPAHDKGSSSFNPKKTPEPSDAQSVYENSVRGDMKTWYGVGKDGQIYRYFDDNAGGVHFSGSVSKESVPKDVLNQLGVKK